ncbi:hypothetical protein SAMN04488020_1067 [Palleronia marisminoris]|uniref:Uncharacterized protein n=1 Tax=Palleronia marisminoris TaxID=315423 RepID=A0A1Y5SWX0_9RHOB|nr:hypothetical protein [Palleronia marisminoris]SFH03709.1 hypothetical protein SAMN04488020_1067 [Palleronia marisminoris]SLN49966.1 hypothetical protein PAM7066_02240 [Palleronia marisminoris]
MKETIVLSDEAYHRLVYDLLQARDEFQVMELIGGVANVWPESALTGPEREHCDRQIAATAELGDRVLRAATRPANSAYECTQELGATPLTWPPARPRPVRPGVCNPPWGTSR